MKLKKQITIHVLLLLFAICSMKVWAKDKVELTWQIPIPNLGMEITVIATEGSTYTIDWGDGAFETITVDENYSEFRIHLYVSTGEYQVVVEAMSPECRFIVFNVHTGTTSRLVFTDCSALITVYCYDNQLVNLDLSGCTSLIRCGCERNKLTSIVLNGCTTLQEFKCDDNQLTNLDISPCTALEILTCTKNQFTDLDLSGSISLKNLHCQNNLINNLNVSNCPKLTYLRCYGNPISELVFSDMPALTYLECYDNQLTHLDVTKCPALSELICAQNQLTHLDISKNSSLVILSCRSNQFQLSELYKISLLLPNYNLAYLGPQFLPSQWVNMDTELFSDQSQFDGMFTTYKVEKEGVLAPESDYSVTKGKLIFHTRGTYTVTMRNDAIKGSDVWPPIVIITLEVVPLSVSATEPAKLTVYPNPTTGELRVKSEELRVKSVELFDIYGRKCLTTQYSILTTINISHLPAGVYFLRVAGQTVKVVKY